MSKRRKPKGYVHHPRYGSLPIPSGQKFSIEEIEDSHWRYGSTTYHPETAIGADISRQVHSAFPRSIYVDIEERCISCNRLFIFFAKEQKHWFEDLKFWIDAHCVRCVECRKRDQEIKGMQFSYESLVLNTKRTAKETEKLKELAMELYQLGYITDKRKIDSLD